MIDFLDYTANSKVTGSQVKLGTFQGDGSVRSFEQKIQYVLEKRDGSMIQQTLNLNSSVVDILSSLVNALHMSGAAKFPPPPLEPSSSELSNKESNHNIHWARDPCDSRTIDHRFDVNTNLGRNLHAFLDSLDLTYIEECRASRMAASAAALVARRFFSFQMIDGISLGWSSKSFAVLLNSLIRLHEEHQGRFFVDSFYPLRLKFSPDEFRSHALDVYGGDIYLNPAATQLEWLQSLQEVTPESLEDVTRNRRVMKHQVSVLQDILGLRVMKGLSCFSFEYATFLNTMVQSHQDMPRKDETQGSHRLILLNSFLSVDGGSARRLVVESPTACRRAKVTEDGSIRIPSNFSTAELENALSRLAGSASDRWKEEMNLEDHCRDAIEKLQWELGIHKVARIGVVGRLEFFHALSRLLNQSSKLSGKLNGHSLRIGSKGRFCSIADDGSLIIPHDWR